MPSRPGVAGGDADRTAAVAAGREGHEPAGDRGRAARPTNRRSYRPCRHGLCVTPLSFVTLTLRPPNSLAVVSPTRHRAAARRAGAATTVDVVVATRSRNTSDASVAGHPATGSSSLIADGHATERLRDVRDRAPRRTRAFGSRNENALRSLARDRGERRFELFDRRPFAARGTRRRASTRHRATARRSSRRMPCQSSWRSAAEMSGTAIFASAPPSAGKIDAGHERRFVGREEQRDVGDVFGQARAE